MRNLHKIPLLNKYFLNPGNSGQSIFCPQSGSSKIKLDIGSVDRKPKFIKLRGIRVSKYYVLSSLQKTARLTLK